MVTTAFSTTMRKAAVASSVTLTDLIMLDLG